MFNDKMYSATEIEALYDVVSALGQIMDEE